MSRSILSVILALLLISGGQIFALELVNESFETNFPPAGWTVMTSGEGPQWNRTDNRSHSGNWSAVVFYGNATQDQDEWLVTPALDTRGLSELTLEWWEDALYWHPLYADYHEILYSTTVPDDPAAFTVLLHMTPADHTPDGMDGDPVVLDLASLIGHETLYLALRYVGTAGDIWYVDDFRCYQPEQRDVGVNAVGPELGWFDVGDYFTPAVEVENFGSEVVDVSAELNINLNGEANDIQMITVQDLDPGEVRTAFFAPHLAAAAGWYDLSVEITLDGDADPDNNSGAAVCYAYTGERLPHGLLVTNWDCSGCPQANQALDEYLAAEPENLTLVRVHGWWPGDNDDPMYHANLPQCNWLIFDTPTGPDYAPHLWLDGTEDAGGDGILFPNLIDARQSIPTPLELTVASEDNGTRARVSLNLLEPVAPGTNLVLRLAVTEDGIEGSGSNGETHHEQVFRYLYPDTNGLAVPVVNGNHEFVIDTPLDSEWVVDNLRLVAWVRDESTKQVFNSAWCPVTVGPSPVPPNPLLTSLVGAYPNPFNPRTEVVFRLQTPGPIEASLYDLAGRRVAVLAEGEYPAGTHRIPWDGCDSKGQGLPSGTYLVRLNTAEGHFNCKVMLCR